MRKGTRLKMTTRKDLDYSSAVVSSRTKNYRRVVMSRQYWDECGCPDINDDLFRKCVFIGYGPSAIRLLMCGLDNKIADVHLTAGFMGYDEGGFEIVVKE